MLRSTELLRPTPDATPQEYEKIEPAIWKPNNKHNEKL